MTPKIELSSKVLHCEKERELEREREEMPMS